VFTGGKGTALGIYSTCQFFGTFAGGAAGGWMMQQFGKMGVVALCVGLAGVWFMLALGSGRALLPDPEQLPRAP
jgi:MFS family permease